MGPAFRPTFGRAAFRNFPRSGKTPKRSRPTTDRPATARASQKMIFQDRPWRVGFLLEGFPKKRGGEISSAMLAGNVLEVLISGKKQHKLTWWWLTNLMENICSSIWLGSFCVVKLLGAKNALSKSPLIAVNHWCYNATWIVSPSDNSHH